MSDKKLNESKIVKDMDYVLVTLADGSVGQIAKSDLASVVAGMQAVEWTGGDLANYDKNGLSFIHHDIDHNPTATDIPLNYCDIIYAQYSWGQVRYAIAIAISNVDAKSVDFTVKLYRKWGDSSIWKELTIS